MTTVTNVNAEQKPVFQTVIVDDNNLQRKLNRRIVDTFLSKADNNQGFCSSVEDFCRGEEAWSVCESNPKDFYVIDYQMSKEMSGVKLSRQILGKFPNAYIVLLTGASLEQIEEEDKTDQKPISQLVHYLNKDEIVQLRTHLSTVLNAWIAEEQLIEETQAIKV